MARRCGARLLDHNWYSALALVPALDGPCGECDLPLESASDRSGTLMPPSNPPMQTGIGKTAPPLNDHG
jgi:hypothetical protein